MKGGVFLELVIFFFNTGKKIFLLWQSSFQRLPTSVVAVNHLAKAKDFCMKQRNFLISFRI
jgi:hypothetical protein